MRFGCDCPSSRACVCVFVVMSVLCVFVSVLLYDRWDMCVIPGHVLNFEVRCFNDVNVCVMYYDVCYAVSSR